MQAKLGSQQLIKPQNERRPLYDTQEVLDSVLRVRRHEPVRLGVRVATNVASGGHIE